MNDTYCPGTSASCPANQPKTDGTACDAGDACIAGGACASGVCLGGTHELTFDPPSVTIHNAEVLNVAIIHSGSKAPIQVTGVTVDPAFKITTQPTWPQTLATGQRAVVALALAETAVGTYNGPLSVAAANCAPTTLSLAGVVEAPAPPPEHHGGCGHGGGVASLLALAPVVGALRRRRTR